MEPEARSERRSHALSEPGPVAPVADFALRAGAVSGDLSGCTLWLGWTMNPVQNFYLGTYAACSTLSGYPGAMTTVRYAEKTAPGRKPEPLLPDDAVKGSDPKQPLALSPRHSSEGWRGVTITPPQKVRAKELRQYLRGHDL